MKRASIGEAKAHFSALIKQAESGEEVLITRGGTPVARVVPTLGAKERYFADDSGLGFVADDFNEPLPDYFLAEFIG